MPNLGKVEVLELHCWQNTWPHARQWCLRTINENATRHLDIYTLTILVKICMLVEGNSIKFTVIVIIYIDSNKSLN